MGGRTILVVIGMLLFVPSAGAGDLENARREINKKTSRPSKDKDSSSANPSPEDEDEDSIWAPLLAPILQPLFIYSFLSPFSMPIYLMDDKYNTNCSFVSHPYADNHQGLLLLAPQNLLTLEEFPASNQSEIEVADKEEIADASYPVECKSIGIKAIDLLLTAMGLA